MSHLDRWNVTRHVTTKGKTYTWISLPTGGYPHGVEAMRSGQTVRTELHGGFASYDEARTYAWELMNDEELGGYSYAKVVKIETPTASPESARSFASGIETP